MPAKRRQTPLKQKPAFNRLKKLIDQSRIKDLVWYHRVGKEVESLCPADDRAYGKSQIDALTEALSQPEPFAQKLWSARRFYALYNRNEVKALCQPKKSSQYRLAWWHMMRLLSLDDADRLRFQRQCINGEWSSRELGDRIKEYRGQKGKGGRKYERPANLADGLKQLIKESTDWQRRFEQVWFHPEKPAIDWDSKRTSSNTVTELCREAVDVLESIQAGIKQQLPALRNHAQSKLKGKTKTVRRRRQK